MACLTLLIRRMPSLNTLALNLNIITRLMEPKCKTCQTSIPGKYLRIARAITLIHHTALMYMECLPAKCLRLYLQYVLTPVHPRNRSPCAKKPINE